MPFLSPDQTHQRLLGSLVIAITSSLKLYSSSHIQCLRYSKANSHKKKNWNSVRMCTQRQTSWYNGLEGSHLTSRTAVAPHFNNSEGMEGWVHIRLVEAMMDWTHTVWVVNKIQNINHYTTAPIKEFFKEYCKYHFDGSKPFQSPNQTLPTNSYIYNTTVTKITTSQWQNRKCDTRI